MTLTGISLDSAIVNALYSAEAKYLECAATIPDTQPHLRAQFERQAKQARAIAEAFELDDGIAVLGSVTVPA